MAFGRNKGGGLDISNVGKSSTRLPGGNMENMAGGLSFASDAKGARSSRGKRKGGTYVRNSGTGTAKEGMPAKTKVLIVLLVVGSLALAIAVGAFVFQMTVKNALKYDLDEAELSQVLTSVEEDASGCWSVVVQTDSTSAEKGRGTLESLTLVWVGTTDEDEATVSLLWLPADLRVYLAGHGYKTLAQVFELEGVTGVVTSAENLADSSVAHYFEANEAGYQRVLAELDLGLDADADSSTVAQAVVEKVAASSSDGISTLASTLEGCVSSDVDADGLAGLLGALQGMDTASIYYADAPTSQEEENDTSYLAIDSDSWSSMVARVESGLSPTASKSELAENASMRSSATVTIWNGVGVTGVAADCEAELDSLGWNVTVTGNAAQYVYDETFIIYKDTADEELANLLAADLAQGRVVRSAARYSFTTTLLVVVGSDYQPY